MKLMRKKKLRKKHDTEKIQLENDVDKGKKVENEQTKDVKETEKKSSRYNTRNKPRVDYRKLNDENFTGSAKKCDQKSGELVYAWDTPSASEDEEPFHVKLEFEIWCEKQPVFIPQNSIFIHYLKDKHPEVDTLKFSTLAETVLSNVMASLPPNSLSSSESQSSLSSSISQPPVPDDATSMEWDNYA